MHRLALLSAWLCLGCGSAPVANARHTLEGGRVLGACDWPSVGAIEPGCTATLITPQWILTAAHCPTSGTFRLGGVGTPIAACTPHPDFISSGRAFDFMVCRLASSVAAPVIPLLAPCEARALAPVGGLPRLLPVGAPVTVLGLGSPTTGQKRAVEMEVSSFYFSPPLIDFTQPSGLGGARPGDSGGPTFMRLGDGTWRQVGVHKLGGAGTSVTDAWVASVVPWIELVTGEDLTPCHLGDRWSPGATCSTLAFGVEDGGGAFPVCALDRRVPVATCLDAGQGMVDAGAADAGSGDAGSDAGAADAGPVDAGSDAGAVDAGSVDAGAVDAGAVDAGSDAGAVDAGSVDAGSGDSGSVDAGAVDAGSGDGGSVDAGSDAGSVDAGTDAGIIDTVDAGSVDAGTDTGIIGPVDAGTLDAGSAPNGELVVGGCGCTSTTWPAGFLAFSFVLARRRRR